VKFRFRKYKVSASGADAKKWERIFALLFPYFFKDDEKIISANVDIISGDFSFYRKLESLPFKFTDKLLFLYNEQLMSNIDIYQLLNDFEADVEVLINRHKLFLYRVTHYPNVPAWIMRYYPRYNPLPFEIAGEIFNSYGLERPYDNYGVWGYEPYDIMQAWYACGCRSSLKFWITIELFAELLKINGRVDTLPKCLPRKKWSAMQTLWFKRGVLAVTKYGKNKNYKPSEIIRFGRLKYPFNYIAIRYGWQAAADCQKDKSKICSYLTPYRSWYWRFKRVPAHIDSRNLIHSALLSNAGVKSYRQLCDRHKNELEAMQLPILNLAVLFGDINSIEQYCKKTSLSLHDAGQFTLPKFLNWTPSIWKPIILKNPKLIRYSSLFDAIEEYCKNNNIPIPNNTRDMDAISSRFVYKNVTNVGVATACSAADCSQAEFEDYQRLYDSPKRAEAIPYIEVTGDEVGLEGNWKMYKLHYNDPRGALLGRITNCCQHLHGAASDCAEAGVKSEFCGFVVVEYNDEIIAQSFAWRGTKGELVFDSIEALGHSYTEGIAMLYQEFGRRILGKLMVRKVLIGAGSGISRYVADYLGLKEAKNPAKQVVKTYSDATPQFALCKNKRIKKVKIDKQSFEPQFEGDTDAGWVCDYCEQPVNVDDTVCPHCGAEGI
jgi:hypothetical protein